MRPKRNLDRRHTYLQQVATRMERTTNDQIPESEVKQMLAVIIAMGIGILIGFFGACAWALTEAKKDKGEHDDRDH